MLPPRPTSGRLRSRRGFPRLRARAAALGLAVAVVGAGCSASNADDHVAASRQATTTTTVVSTTTAAPVVTTTTDPGPAPLAPYEVLVADVRPEVTKLTTYDAPDGAPFAPELAQVNPWYFGGGLSLLVVKGLERDPWLEVALPSRPNGLTAWIKASDVTLRRHRFHITVAVGERMLRAYEADTLLLETPVVVGRPNTPTPLGTFFVNAEIPQQNPAGAYGPMILSVSAFSEVLDSFDGGLPEIGLHGTNQPSLIGTAASNGCIRMPNEAIVQLEHLVPLGTVVQFVA
jgi:lipoprotein-anchoring transpeptidase ErfK/SrfK